MKPSRPSQGSPEDGKCTSAVWSLLMDRRSPPESFEATLFDDLGLLLGLDINYVRNEGQVELAHYQDAPLGV